MRNQYFRSKDESSLEVRFKEQQDQTTDVVSDLSQIANDFRKIYVGDLLPSIDEFSSMSDGDIWLTKTTSAVVDVIVAKTFTGPDGPLADTDFTTYKESTLDDTTNGLSWSILGGKLSLKATNSANRGAGNVCDFGVRFTNAIAMPTGTQRLVIEYDQGPENVIGATTSITSPVLNIIDAGQWPTVVGYTPYYSSGVTNASILFNRPTIEEGVVNTTMALKGSGVQSPAAPNADLGGITPYSLPTMAHIKVTLYANTITVEKNGVIVPYAPSTHGLAGKDVYIAFGNGMYENGATIDVQFDNIFIARYAS